MRGAFPALLPRNRVTFGDHAGIRKGGDAG